MAALVDYALVTGAAGATTAVATPIVWRVAVKHGWVVEPDGHRLHAKPTPALGGIAMWLGLCAGLLVAWSRQGFDEVFSTPTELIGVFAAATVIFAVGLLDDVRPVSAPAKLAGVVLAGSVLTYAGVSIIVFRVPFFDLLLLSADWSALLTVVWVVAITNAVNLIDGLDGLAAGTVAIAAATLFLYTLRLTDAGVLLEENPAAVVSVIAVGLCVGFLPHNFHPAKIFMGDSGALLLGLLMAASTIMVGGRTAAPFSGQAFFFFAPVTIPLLILAVPLLDTILAFSRRTLRRRSFAQADREHLHHRLMQLGHGHRRTVVIMWSWTLLLSAFVLIPTYTGTGDAFVPIGIAALALLLYSIFHSRLPALVGVRGRHNDEQTTPAEVDDSGALIDNDKTQSTGTSTTQSDLDPQ
ncbi:MAG: undecaprenyl/decaprenyl-phosphate alpha-N-acetylglucosaminyl 1-phosphate transferase [Acidobacteria bacterium]|nr:undecaprenyl/decaprenyl-phosphate alpha-N-acetylglucosaminyl 1-phosphate transferase [Acidobacteriota bacterium]